MENIVFKHKPNIENYSDTKCQSNAEISEDDILKYLNQTIELLHEVGNKDFENNMREYVKKRGEYIKTHKGKIVQVTQDGIDFLDENDKPYKGLTMKVGSEISKSYNVALYTMNYNVVQTQYFMQLRLGYRGQWTLSFDALVDTGCTRTILDRNILMHILRSYPNYNITRETISAVDSNPLVDAGTIDISFCGRLYQDTPVYYAKIPVNALIGTDLINSGKLDIDSGNHISFTMH